MPGTTLLENSVVLWVTSYTRPGGHHATDLPILLAGGGAGSLSTGRIVDYSTSGSSTAGGIRGDGASLNDLYLTLARLWIPGLAGFGDPEMHLKGALSGLVKT